MSADLLAERGVRRLIQATADIYREALDAPTIGYEMPPLMRKKLEEDIFVFSGFKTYHQLKEASLLLRNEAGGLKPFYKFYQDVTSIKEKYNRHWLRAEYNFATASAEMAAQWAAYEEVKGTTYLQYRTALDDRVRAEHAALEGVTLPLDDPFWDTAFPPNGWNCRCHVIPVPQEGHTTSNSEAACLSFRQLTEGRDSIFRFNPGKEAVLFPPHHPYYGKQGYRHCANQRLAANDDKHDPGDPCRVYRTLHEPEKKEIRTPLTPKQKKERKHLTHYLKKKYTGVFVELSGCREKIQITSTSIDEIVNQPFGNYQGKMNAIKELDKFIKKSTWLGKIKPRAWDKHESFIARTEIEGEKCYIIFVQHKGTPLKIYSITDADMEQFLYDKEEK